jgi:hypothetical protein
MILAYSSILWLATHIKAVFAIFTLKKVSTCARILKTSLTEKGMPRHLKFDSFSGASLTLVRLKK